MPVSDSQKKSWLSQIDQANKKMIDIESRAKREIASEQKKIIDLQAKIAKR